MGFGLKTLLRKRITFPVAGVFLLVAVVVALFWFQPRFLVRQFADQNPKVFFFARTGEKVLALTIDDAPDSTLSPLILDLLAEHGVPATFFVLGENIPGNEDIIARMKAEGHELGNHLARDQASITLSDQEFAAQLLAVEKLIGPLGPTKWCRPGSGWFSPKMVKTAHELGYRCCLGSIYPFDNKLRQPGLIRDTVLSRIYPGAILVLHEGGQEREYILPLLSELVPALQAEGYRFLTLSDLEKLDQP
jgi:peptidoglycan/xylan/chitin deacetylase (PgdA/CDA1 family)